MAELAACLTAGAVIGALYFVGLWLTVRDLERARRPAMRLAVSAAARLAFVVAAFWLVMDGRGERLLACLAGFIAARLAATRIVARRGHFTRRVRTASGRVEPAAPYDLEKSHAD